MTLEQEQEICPYCDKPMVKHIIKEGARYHVTSWYKGKNGACSHCSEENCENNHGPGHCVPAEPSQCNKYCLKKSSTSCGKCIADRVLK